jgi:hypothetical protein
MVVKAYFYVGIGMHLLAHFLVRKGLKIKSTFIGEHHHYGPDVRLVSIQGSQGAHRVLIGKINTLL